MAQIINRSFLGRGWSFPPTFDNQTGEVVMVSEETDIEQSLQILLGTRPGERVMQPDFGCNLDIMLFEPLTITLITLVKDLIRTAILRHEPRIEVRSIAINTLQVNEGLVMIEIDYLVRSTNSRFNLVYPFYLEEGSNITSTR
jgi:uncharacterized protein